MTTHASSGMATAPAEGVEGEIDFWMMVHRALRGRYLRMTVFAAVLAIVCAILGSMLGQRVYSSTGLVRVAIATPALLKETDQNKPIPNFDGYIQAQKEVMTSRETIRGAMNTEVWHQLVASGKGVSEAQFSAGLKVDTRPRSDHLKVTFTNADPEVAAAGVQAIIQAYQNQFAHKAEEFEGERLGQLRARQASLTGELAALAAERRGVSGDENFAELALQCMVAADRVKKLRGALSDVQSALAGGPQPAPRTVAVARTPEEAALEAELKQASAVLAQAQSQLERMTSAGFSEEHRLVRRLAGQVREGTARVQSLRAALDIHTDSKGMPDEDLPLKEREQNLITLAAEAEAALKDVTSRRARLEEINQSTDSIQQSLQETEDRLDALTTESMFGGRLTVVNSGDVPMAPTFDNRLKAGALGGMLGFFLPFGACVVGSLIRRRARFGADVRDELGDRVPCVVTTPDLRSHPRLAAAACHSVHDLRLLLQPRTASDRRTLLISDARTNNAETDLALTLALSFVSAGFRTLLIDGDLTSKRLSELLCAGDCPGFCNAATGSDPLLWQTNSGVAFLSAGLGASDLAHRLPPTSTARLLSWLRDRFDVILISSDSMTVGLNAPSLVPLVDGVVLGVQHGELMAHVREAAERVETLGGVLAGAVFAGAAASEFKDTLGGIKGQSINDARNSPIRLGMLVDAMSRSMGLDLDNDFHLNAASMSLKASDRTQRAA